MQDCRMIYVKHSNRTFMYKTQWVTNSTLSLWLAHSDRIQNHVWIDREPSVEKCPEYFQLPRIHFKQSSIHPVIQPALGICKVSLNLFNFKLFTSISPFNFHEMPRVIQAAQYSSLLCID